jgi:hypothetical protein
VTGCGGFSVNHPRRTRIRDFHTDPSYPSQSLKTKGKTRHFVLVTTRHQPVTGESGATVGDTQRGERWARLAR